MSRRARVRKRERERQRYRINIFLQVVQKAEKLEMVVFCLFFGVNAWKDGNECA